MARCHVLRVLVGLVVACAVVEAVSGYEFQPQLVPNYNPGYNPNPYPPAAYYPQPRQQYYPRQEYYQPQPQPYDGQPGQPEQYYEGQPMPDMDPDYASFLDQTPAGESAVAQPSTSGGGGGGESAPSVQTPDQTADSTASGSPSTPPANSNMDALDLQLAAALEAVKADMISKGKQVLEEKQWTDDVKGVIEQYTKKISNVYGNIEKLKKDMTDLYKKKQQIINAQIQKRLTQQLKDSKSDLQTVQAALDKVTNTQMEFEQSKKDIQATIDSIFTQLSELKGQPAPAPGAAEGEAAAKEGDKKEGDAKEGEEEEGAKGETTEAASEAGAGASSDSSEEDSDTDIVDRTAEINSKIDTIKSIVSALNKGSPSAVQ